MGDNRPQKYKSLPTLLRKLFPEPLDARSLRDNAPRHKGLVITLCVLAACLLWFTVSMRQTYTQFFEFPTEVRNLPAHLALRSLPPASVRIQVEGEGIQLLRLFYNPPTVPIDAGREEVDLNIVAPELTKSVRTESVMPRLIRVETDTRVERRIPIRSRVGVFTQAGYHVVGSVQLTPDSVTVSGASSILETLDSWPTDIVDIRQAKDSIDTVVALTDTLVGLVAKELAATTIRASVLEFTEGNRLLQVRVAGIPRGRSVRLDPPSAVVTYQVPIQSFDAAFEAEDFFATVPFSEILRDTSGRVYPRLHLPLNITLREVRLSPEALGYYFVLGSE